jgi:serine/threonine protein kinase
MPVKKPEAFLKFLKKSKLLDSEGLAKATEMAQECADAKSLARGLFKNGSLTRWQAEQLLAGRTAFFVGKYKLVGLLARGRMGGVFLAEHTIMDRTVVVKAIPKDLGRDEAALDTFLREARSIADLDHTNIVRAYSVDSVGERYFMVMEYVEGQDLQRLVEAKGPLDASQAADYIRQAAKGLAYVHGRDMIHGDIKPANLFVGEQDVVKILDMGMAQLTGQSRLRAKTTDEGSAGAADYVAPEQTLETGDIDHRADVYSLGCTLYFLLTGRPPFSEGTIAERILKHQKEQPAPVSEQRPEVPQELAAIAEKMMAKDPSERYQSAEEVSKALTEWLPSKSTSAPAEPAKVAAASEAVGPFDIKVDTSPSARVARKTTPRISPAKEEAVPATGVFASRRRLLLAGGIGGGILLLGAVVLLLVFMFSGPSSDGDGTVESETVAQKDSDEAPETDLPDEDTPDETLDETDSTEIDLDALIGSVNDTKPASVKKTEPEPETPETESAEEGPADKQEEPEAEQEQPTEPAMVEEEKEGPSPEPAEPDESAKPAEPDKPGKPSEADKPEPAESAEEKPEQPEPEKPEPEKPEPKQEPKKTEEKPFRELAQAVELPVLDDGGAPPEASVLGKIHTPPDTKWQLSLAGGEHALKSSRANPRTFSLKEQDADAAKASWTVALGGATDATDVARIWREGNSLNFQWADGAEANTANCLRNCVLDIRAGRQSHKLSLRQPQQVEPLTFNLVNGTSSATLPVDWLPDASTVRVEITKVEGREDFKVTPSGPADPKKPLELSFERKDRHGNASGGALFRVTFMLRTSGINARVELSQPPVKDFKQPFFRSEEMLTIAKNQIEQQRKLADEQLHPGGNKRPTEQQRIMANQQLDVLDQNAWYIELFEQLHEKPSLYFRIFFEVDGGQVDLATT